MDRAKIGRERALDRADNIEAAVNQLTRSLDKQGFNAGIHPEMLSQMTTDLSDSEVEKIARQAFKRSPDTYSWFEGDVERFLKSMGLRDD